MFCFEASELTYVGQVQVVMVDAPFIFKPGWAMVKPWLKKYSALVQFVSREQLAEQYFTPQTLPPEFK